MIDTEVINRSVSSEFIGSWVYRRGERKRRPNAEEFNLGIKLCFLLGGTVLSSNSERIASAKALGARLKVFACEKSKVRPSLRAQPLSRSVQFISRVFIGIIKNVNGDNNFHFPSLNLLFVWQAPCPPFRLARRIGDALTQEMARARPSFGFAIIF